jgi:ADP-ribose pyrophosphatase YjhB (NUDIX family)
VKIGVACHAVVKKGDKILLGIRNKPIALSHGQYFTVGGSVEFMEKREDCLRREVMEEANIKIKNICFFKVYKHIRPENKRPHSVVFIYKADYDSGELKGADDCIDPQFYSVDQIKEFIKEGTLAWFPKQVLEEMGEI